MSEDDPLVADYLRRLRKAARHLPPAQRRELVDEIAGHIAEARAAEQASGSSAGTDSVRALLARLGAPGDIVRAAGGPAGAGRPGALEISAVTLLLIGGFLYLAGWVVGCVLLWVSPRWRWTDKLLGTLVWPGGLYLPYFAGGLPASRESCVGKGIATTCASTGPPQWVQWLGIPILLILLAAPVAVAVRLLRRARRLPGQDVTNQLTQVP